MTHPKAFAAGVEAMGLWLWGMAFAKQHRTDGRVHRPAVLGAWGGKRNVMLAKRLVDAGLWIARDDGDWDIHNFEKKGPGRQSSSAERMRRLRSKRKEVTPGDVTCDAGDASGDANEVTLCSTSSSLSVSSDLVSAEDLPDRLPTPPPVETGPPPWFGDAIATVEVQTGESLRPPDCWLRYSGHRGNVGKPMNQRDAVYWLTTVMVPEARKERRAESERRERQAQHPSGPRLVDAPKSPYHELFKPPESGEAPASRELAVAASERLAGLFQ
jgi:hypothetical protein